MARPGFRATGTVIYVDASSVIGMMDRLERSLMPSSLGAFLETKAWPIFQQRMVDRFAYQGDGASGHWPDLSPATVAIKEKLGVEFPDVANVRTGEMMEYLTSSHLTEVGVGGGSQLSFPVAPSDPIMARKIEVAQGGASGPNWLNAAMRPTPPRPVLAIDESDMVLMLKALSFHVIDAVAGPASFGYGGME